MQIIPPIEMSQLSSSLLKSNNNTKHSQNMHWFNKIYKLYWKFFQTEDRINQDEKPDKAKAPQYNQSWYGIKATLRKTLLYSTAQMRSPGPKNEPEWIIIRVCDIWIKEGGNSVICSRTCILWVIQSDKWDGETLDLN